MSDGPVPALGPEERWLLAAGLGDRCALESLYARFARPLMTFLYALTADRTLAEDLVQETFVRAWQAAPRWEPRARASTWLFTIARHAASHARARRRPSLMASPPAPSRLDPAAAEGRELSARLADAVAGLPTALRVAFVLVRVSGLSLSDAASAAQIPVGTVKSRLNAAEKALRRTLADLVGETGGAA